MTKIDDGLYIGGKDSPAQAKDRGIQAILNVCRGLNYAPPDGIEYEHHGLNDDGSNSLSEIQEATDALANFRRRGLKTLVHCYSGISRAPSIAALYYSQNEGFTLRSALEAIQRARSVANPNDAIWFTICQCASLCSYEPR